MPKFKVYVVATLVRTAEVEVYADDMDVAQECVESMLDRNEVEFPSKGTPMCSYVEQITEIIEGE